jgi:Zn-finger nucleic acid-binding protein
LWIELCPETRMVKPFAGQLPKLTTRVRFPSPAPMEKA